MKILVAWLGRSLGFLLGRGPDCIRTVLGKLIGFLWFDVLRIRRKVIIDNIGKAFPEMPMKERIKLGRLSLKYFGRNILDYSLLPCLTKDNFENYLEFENLEIMDRALAKGKGVMMLTLHVGAGDLACAGLSLKGYPVYLVSKFFKTQWLNDLWFGMRQRLGTQFIAPRNSTFALLRALKNNGLVILPLDQFTGPPIGVKTKFFGIETGTAAGFALMAHRAKAAVVLAYTVRASNNKHAVYVVKELPFTLKEGDDQSLIDVTQGFNDELELLVRKHPEQWMWLHRRWKKFVVQ